MMKTLVLRSFFIWVLSSVLIHAMVIPVDFSTGDFSFSIDNVTVVDSAVDVSGDTFTVPSNYVDEYLATILVNNDSQTVTASYTGLEIESEITFDGDNVLSPGESFELTLSIENLFVEPNQITVDIESVFGDDEDTNRISERSSENIVYRFDVSTTQVAGEFDIVYVVNDQYGTEYFGEETVVIQRTEEFVISDASYDDCTNTVEYTVVNYGTGDVQDAIIRVEQESLMEYDFISVSSGTGYGKLSGELTTDASKDFTLRLYDSDGGQVDYYLIDYSPCTQVQVVSLTTVETPTAVDPIQPGQTVPTTVPGVSVSSEYWGLTEAQVAAYIILIMVSIIAMWTLLFLIKYIFT